MQLLSQAKNKQSEKQAFLGALGKGMQTLSKRNDFLGGLAAPVVNFYGGLRRAGGYAQQLPSVIKNPNAAKSELLKDELFSRGARNIRRGNSIRGRAGIQGIFDPSRSTGYRVGRGLGALSVGAPLAMAPFTAAEYLGASSADPALAEEYAKNVAYERIQDRLKQFSSMPFLARVQTAWNPQKFTESLEMPEADDLYSNIANNKINNPGILKYLTGFHPFMGGASSVIKQKVQSEALNNMAGNKEASVSNIQANLLSQLYSKVLVPAYTHGKKFRGLPMGTKSPAGYKAYNPFKDNSYLEGLAGTYARALGKNPVLTSLGTLGTAFTPLGLYGSYKGGENQVYTDAAATGEGMADLGLREQFNQPGFMGGLGRAGMAIAPGIGSDMILKQIRQSMFPKVSNPGQ